jgi:hypothetical protein
MPLEGLTWHGCPRLPALRRAGPGRPSHANIPSRVAFVSSRGSCHSRVLRGMGARGCLLYVEQVPGDLLTRISRRGSPLFRVEGHATRGFYVAWVPAVACSTSSRSRATFSRGYPVEGRLCFEPRVRLARGLSLLGKGPGHLIALRSWPRFCSAGAPFKALQPRARA